MLKKVKSYVFTSDDLETRGGPEPDITVSFKWSHFDGA